MAYTVKTRRQWRSQKGPLSEKLESEFTAVKTEYDTVTSDETTKRQTTAVLQYFDAALADGDHGEQYVFDRDVVIDSLVVFEQAQITSSGEDVFQVETDSGDIAASLVTVSSASADNPVSSSFGPITVSAGVQIGVNVNAAAATPGLNASYMIGYYIP